jgi:geranylgeranyl diphosphate synthase type II
MTMTVSRPDSSNVVDAVTARIEDFFEQKQRLAIPYGRRYAELWGASRRASEGGKRLRPALVINAYRAFGGDRDDDAVVVATAFELLHTAFILHDDVIDGDTVRRGLPNLVGAFASQASDEGASAADAQGWGEASAILAGDLLIHSAQALVARLSIAEAQRCALLDLLEDCMFVTAAGELADVAFGTAVDMPVLSEVLLMAQWKTARYSFQAPLQAGAILAGASEETLRVLGEYGKHVGTAFQLRDDILGVFGEESVTGKSASSDLRGAKITPLMCYALLKSDTDELQDILQRDALTAQDAARARRLVEDSGARTFIERLIDDHTLTAVGMLDDGAIPGVLRNQLSDVAHRARERSS